jgi:hypothetical protein
MLITGENNGANEYEPAEVVALNVPAVGKPETAYILGQGIKEPPLSAEQVMWSQGRLAIS